MLNYYSDCNRQDRVGESSDLTSLKKHHYLVFKLYCRSNNLTWEKEISKRQFILLKTKKIKRLQKNLFNFINLNCILNLAVIHFEVAQNYFGDLHLKSFAFH